MYLVQESNGMNVYALKRQNQDNIINNRIVEHMKAEKAAMEAIDHPFIIKFHFSKVSDYTLDFFLDYVQGKNLY